MKHNTSASSEHIAIGAKVIPARDYASLRERNGDVILWEIPETAIGTVLDSDPTIGTVKVAWSFGAIGWTLRDNLVYAP